MELQICMIPSPEDPPLRSDDYQSALRSLGMVLRSDGLDIHDVGARQSSAAMSGEWRVDLDAAVAPVLQAPLGLWLQARRGRAARLRIGEIEADVRTIDELVRVIRIAKCYQDVVESDA